jgi:hypothetical protein
MTRGLIYRALSAMALAFSIFTPAQSEPIEAGQRARPHHHHRSHVAQHGRIVLPPEQHVIEKTQPPYSGNYLINDTWFTAKTLACSRWVARERIKLLAGDWHGACADAVFYNVTRRQTCELSCR